MSLVDRSGSFYVYNVPIAPLFLKKTCKNVKKTEG